MRLGVIFLLFSVLLGAQSLDEIVVDETEDPDEGHYLNELLVTLFQPFNLEIADSSMLDSKGFSREAITSILEWQGKGASRSALKRLQKRLGESDKVLLQQISWEGKEGIGLNLRQRLQSGASSEGWRILQKGRLRSPWGNLIFLLEQDPGEARLSDHSILTLSSHRLPGFHQVMLGDFHVRWGAGLILNQQGFRSSLNPNSLLIRSPLAITPHYSSRETDYFRGIAGEWNLAGIKAAMFISSRKAVGVFDGVEFREDSDGIHPSGKQYNNFTQRFAGMAGIFEAGALELFSAVIFNPETKPAGQYELGMTWHISGSQLLQLFTDRYRLGEGRSIIAWSYKSKTVIYSIQYRRYKTTTPLSSGSVLALLGTSATNESGLAIRTQIRPNKQVLLRYALDTGFSSTLNDLKENNRVVQHKVQLFLKQTQRDWQLDISLKRAGPITPIDIWNSEINYDQISKLALSLSQKISPKFQYRLNLKTATNSSDKSMLIQQRLMLNAVSLKASIGFVRFIVPEYGLRLSIYETSLLESFSFYTAYEDGQRWFIYVERRFREQVDLEMRLAHSHLDQLPFGAKQLEVSLQLSIVL